MKTAQEWVLENKDKYPGFQTDAIVFTKMVADGAKEVGVVPENIQRAAKKMGLSVPKRVRGDIAISDGISTKNQTTSNIGISETDFRAKFDPLFQVREAVSKLAIGVFYKDSEFKSTIARSTHSGFRSQSESVEFDPYRGRAGGITYWGHPTSIKKLKEEGVLT